MERDDFGHTPGGIACEAARELLLEAEIEELEGHGEAALVGHLRGCARCAALARAVLAGQRELDAALASLAHDLTQESPLTARSDRPAAGSHRPAGPSWRRLAPLAAAAVLAALLLLPSALRRELPNGGESTGDASLAANGATPPGLRVEAPEGERVAVFETSDPTITVVWFY